MSLSNFSEYSLLTMSKSKKVTNVVEECSDLKDQLLSNAFDVSPSYFLINGFDLVKYLVVLNEVFFFTTTVFKKIVFKNHQ